MSRRGASYIELMVVLAVIAALLCGFGLPAYRSYAMSRAPVDAATALAEDLSLLARSAQNGKLNDGASLIIVSADPLQYRGYRGRPTSIDPNSALGALLVERSFPGVMLASGPIGPATPLLFASNGSAQYVSHGTVAGQHATIEFSLSRGSEDKAARVDLDLFTGAVTMP
jgi:hypothetical protein